MSNESKVREAFENNVHLRWHPDANGPELLDRDPADGYYNTAVEYAWRVWLASRAAALEEAAEALRLLRPNSEGYKRSEWDKFDWEQPCADAIDTAFDIGAAAIRALAAKEGL